MKRKQLQTKVLDSTKEFNTLVKRVAKSANPDPKDIARVRELVESTPTIWSRCRSITQIAREMLIKRISAGSASAYLLVESDILKKQLGWDEASPLEKLMIEQVLTARLRQFHAEDRYNSSLLGESTSIEMAEYREGVLSATQARYLRAIETLARVSRLARNTPGLQINIAQHGGQQVNTQGDVSTRT